MKSKNLLLGLLAITLVFAMTAVGCDNDSADNNGGEVPPENKPVKDRWGKWVADDATATLVYSVDNDGVCTITVGGTAQPNDESDEWGRWKAQAQYDYTTVAGKSFTYTFEAWTASGTRDFAFVYCVDDVNKVYLAELISLTTTRQTYTVNGQPLSKNPYQHVQFECADQLGTFYVKMLGIKEIGSGGGEAGTFTLTGIPSQYNGKYVMLSGHNEKDDDRSVSGCQSINMSTQIFTLSLISNGSVSIPLWTYNNGSFVRYSGNDTFDNIEIALFNTQTINAGNSEGCLGVLELSSVTFANGSATRAWSNGYYNQFIPVASTRW